MATISINTSIHYAMVGYMIQTLFNIYFNTWWWWACFEKSIGVWSEGQEELRTTEEDKKDTSGKESKSVGFEEDALNRVRWRVGVGDIAVRVG